MPTTDPKYVVVGADGFLILDQTFTTKSEAQAACRECKRGDWPDAKVVKADSQSHHLTPVAHGLHYECTKEGDRR